MGWLWGDRRGPAWKQGWRENTLASISLPPFPLLAIFIIIFLLLSLSTYFKFKYQMQSTVINFKLVLLFLPVILIIVAQLISKYERFFAPPTKAQYDIDRRRHWDLPWGVAVLVVLLLVMVSYQSSLRSIWSPIVWRSD